jgi:lipopolysaccharide/colanic/teichoic acid biosynthesis glycosyltransferase
MYRRWGKRIFDIVASFLGLLIVSPLLAIVAIALWWSNDGKVLFYQLRPGLGGKPFWIIKFKTMTDERGSDGKLLPDYQRVTPVGRLVRTLSIDELLQLINVLKGEMSLIGPRPLLPEYMPFYSEWEQHRHDVRPGISGLAQVCGRNSIGWNRKLRYDSFYVSHLSFQLDMLILFRTLAKVVKACDIDPDYSSTTIEFDDYVRQGRVIKKHP